MGTSAEHRGFIEFPMRPSGTALPKGVRMNDADADRARSESNILQWVSYLPEDCIKKMIEMGWDVTT
jgi:hypothetical protein